MRGNGQQIQEVVLIAMCVSSSPIAPQPSAAECRSGRAGDDLRRRAEAEVGGDLGADRADHRARSRPAAAACAASSPAPPTSVGSYSSRSRRRLSVSQAALIEAWLAAATPVNRIVR